VTGLRFAVPVVVLAGLAALFYAGLASGPPGALPSPFIGKPAPDFSLPALDARTHGFARADLRGHPTLVNFWASWCPPCRVEHPMLMALARDQGIVMFGVVYKDAPEKARAFLDELGNPFSRVAMDRDGRVAIDWGVTGAPETFVVDAQGIVRAHVVGALTTEIFDRVIRPALGR